MHPATTDRYIHSNVWVISQLEAILPSNEYFIYDT